MEWAPLNTNSKLMEDQRYPIDEVKVRRHFVKQLLRAWWAVLLLSFVAVIAIPMFSGDLDRNYAVVKTKQDILGIEAALEHFKGRTGEYPTQERGVATLVGPDLARLPVDFWGSRYSYSFDRTGKPFVYSNGANRRDEAGLGDCEPSRWYCSWLDALVAVGRLS